MSKTTNQESIVINGGGLTSLLLAMKLSKLGYKVHIVEKSPSIGGMYNSKTYENSIVFDIGMHIYYETCDPEIDDLFYSLLPENEWVIRGDNHKDIAGIFFNNRLQTDSPYVDLRNFKDEEKKRFLADITLRLDKEYKNQYLTAQDYLLDRFGESITNEVFAKILGKLYDHSLDQLDVLGAYLVKMDRVVLYDSETMLDLMKSSKIRSRLAYPDQMTLPPYRTNTQKMIYPKRFGLEHLMAIFKQKLLDLGVEIHTNSIIENIKLDNNLVEKVSIKQQETSFELATDHLFWSTGYFSLAPLMNISLENYKFKHKSMVMVNLMVDKEPNMDLLYYFYCFDPGFSTFRVTHYANYCPGAQSNTHGYPLCVELWANELEPNTDYKALALKELRDFGVINDQHKITFAIEEKYKIGFPLPTVANIETSRKLRELVDSKNIQNLDVIGILSKDNIFFLKDTLIDAFSRISRLKVSA